MKRRAELLRVQTNVPCGTPLTAPQVTTGGLCRWKAINKEGRHVGLDFYDLLIEGHSAHRSRTFIVNWLDWRRRRLHQLTSVALATCPAARCYPHPRSIRQAASPSRS